MASARDIMLEGPLGGAAFNNEFGRPNLCGYFRTYEELVPSADGFEDVVTISRLWWQVGWVRFDLNMLKRIFLNQVSS